MNRDELVKKCADLCDAASALLILARTENVYAIRGAVDALWQHAAQVGRALEDVEHPTREEKMADYAKLVDELHYAQKIDIKKALELMVHRTDLDLAEMRAFYAALCRSMSSEDRAHRAYEGGRD